MYKKGIFIWIFLSVTIESFICKQISASLIWVFMFTNTFISCQILYVLSLTKYKPRKVEIRLRIQIY